MSIELKNIEFDKIFFSKTKHKSKNSFLYVYYDKKPLVLKYPKMRLPFGVKKDSISSKSQYILDVSFENQDELLMQVQQLDEYIIEKANKEIFPEKTKEEVSSMYVSCIKYPQDTRYYPTFRSKIITQNETQIKCSFYNSEKNEEGGYDKIDIEKEGGEGYMMIALQKNSYIESIIECIGIWVREDRFGLSFKTTQTMVYPKIEFQPKESVCEFVDTDDSTSNSDVDFLD